MGGVFTERGAAKHLARAVQRGESVAIERFGRGYDVSIPLNSGDVNARGRALEAAYWERRPGEIEHSAPEMVLTPSDSVSAGNHAYHVSALLQRAEALTLDPLAGLF
jgi:hypothetical protein